MNKQLYEYLEKEWRISNHKKYQKYFKVWVKNITDDQIFYFTKDMNKRLNIGGFA